jgi:hypothetical protein
MVYPPSVGFPLLCNKTGTRLSSGNISSAGRGDAIQIAESILQECFGCLLLKEVTRVVASNCHVSSGTFDDIPPSFFLSGLQFIN